MSIDPQTQQAISDAWQDQQGWANGLAQQAQGTSIPTVPLSGEIGVCYIQNAGGDPDNPNVWEDDGSGSMQVSGLTVSSLAGTAWSAAVFPQSGPDVIFPVAFGSLAVNGSYSFSQPCALYDTTFDKKVSSDSYTGTGSVSQSATSGEIQYQASWTAGSQTPLTLTGVAITGNQSTSVNPDGEGGILGALTSFLTGNAEMYAVQSAVGNVFQSAQFSQTMIGLLNQKLGA